MTAYVGILKSDALIALLFTWSGERWLASPWMLALVSFILSPLVLHLLHPHLVRLLLRLPEQWRLNTLPRKLGVSALGFILLGTLTPTNELHTLELRMARLCAEGAYQRALDEGINFSTPSPQLVGLRTFALTQLQNDTDSIPLSTRFFDYPLPHNADATMLLLDSTASSIAPFYHRICHTAAQQLPSPELQAARQRQIHLLGLLLDRKLTTFVHTLAQEVSPDTIDVERLPTSHREALVLYMRRTTQPLLRYSDANIEANYRDFADLRQRILTGGVRTRRQPAQVSVAEANLMHRDYGQTYWWYFFYNTLLNAPQ